jgi:hypothetical protein
MSVVPSDYDSDPERFLADREFPHDDVHQSVAARLAGASAQRVLDVGGGSGKLARLTRRPSSGRCSAGPGTGRRSSGGTLPWSAS